MILPISFHGNGPREGGRQAGRLGVVESEEEGRQLEGLCRGGAGMWQLLTLTAWKRSAFPREEQQHGVCQHGHSYGSKMSPVY